jgi:hypothetical protein
MGYLNRLMVAQHLAKLPLATHTRDLYCEIYDTVVRYHIPFHSESIHKVVEVIPTANGLTIVASKSPQQREELPPDSIKVE